MYEVLGLNYIIFDFLTYSTLLLTLLTVTILHTVLSVPDIRVLARSYRPPSHQKVQLEYFYKLLWFTKQVSWLFMIELKMDREKRLMEEKVRIEREMEQEMIR